MLNQDSRKRPSPSELVNDRLIMRYAESGISILKDEVNCLRKRVREFEEESKSKEEKIGQLKVENLELKSKGSKLVGFIYILLPFYILIAILFLLLLLLLLS
jgi:predicted nuclease with TOPRIM domain